MHPWPQIQQTPTGYREDGRFAKSFPLELPFGVGDLYQPRVRSDFSTLDWAQRQLQYYDGRCISSRRGNRFTWAIFNEALRETSHHTGRLVFKNTNESVLTKQELQELTEKRQDLVQKISSFGADIPTTPMMWKHKATTLNGSHGICHGCRRGLTIARTITNCAQRSPCIEVVLSTLL